MIALYGAGGLGQEIMDGILERKYLAEAKPVSSRSICWMDDNYVQLNCVSEIYNVPTLHRNTDNKKKNSHFCIAIGDPLIRGQLFNRLILEGLQPLTLIHESAQISLNCSLGVGCLIGPFTYVGPQSIIADNAAMNIYSSVGHHATLGHSAVLSPYATMNGNSHVGDRSFLGTRASILSGAKLGSQSKISAGSVLNENTESGALCVGNPARCRVIYKTAEPT